MSNFIEIIKAQIPNDFFTETELKRIGLKSADSRYGLVKRAIANKDIIRIRRGLYCLSKKHQRYGIDLFELAQPVYRPSYISLESALSYHGWIPEGVPTITSVSLKRSIEFKTPLGIFSYSRNPKYDYVGVERIRSGKSLFLMADPTKALIDYMYIFKKNWKVADPLIISLRIEQENLEKLNKDILLTLKNKGLSRRVTYFIDGLIKDLGL
jgi:predicted transcriptional regulator of viral defense system